nr:unnamed protein product [Digitaria exilis]
MASSSSSTPLLALPVTEKLTKRNFVLWQAQVMPAIRGAQLEDHLDSFATVPAKQIVTQVADKTVKQPNPEYATWVAKDQQVLSYLLTSMTRDLMAQVASHKTAAAVWTAAEARLMNTLIALVTAQKGDSTMAEYLPKMRSLADDVAAPSSHATSPSL